MFVLGNILMATANILELLFNAYRLILIVYCIISWVNPDPYHPIVRFLRNVTEPVLWRVRKYLPFTYMKGLDLSPILVLFVLYFLESVIISSLTQFALRLN